MPEQHFIYLAGQYIQASPYDEVLFAIGKVVVASRILVREVPREEKSFIHRFPVCRRIFVVADTHGRTFERYLANLAARYRLASIIEELDRTCVDREPDRAGTPALLCWVVE